MTENVQSSMTSVPIGALRRAEAALRRTRRTKRSMLGALLVVCLGALGLAAASVGAAVDPNDSNHYFPDGDNQNIPDSGSCGTSGGRWVKFTAPGNETTSGTYEGNSGSPDWSATYSAEAHLSGTDVVISSVRDEFGNLVTFESAVIKLASTSPIYNFPRTTTSPKLHIDSAYNFTQFAICALPPIVTFTVKKVVDNAASDPTTFTLSVACYVVVDDRTGELSTVNTASPTSVQLADDGTATISAPANSVCSVTEPSVPSAYDLISISPTSPFTLTLNGPVPTTPLTTITVTNRAKLGTLRVTKVVTNNDGGTATADDFSFSVSGGPTAVNSGNAVSFDADGTNEYSVLAGTYNVTESAAAGYTTSYNPTPGCDSVVVPAGGTATCTITNDDIAPTLTLEKIVVNNAGGTAVATDFTLTATGPKPISGAGGVTDTVKAGTYTLSESSVTGYEVDSNWSCNSTTDTNVADGLILQLGENVTCKVTNGDIAPKLTLVKKVVNDNGGTAAVGDFTLKAGATTFVSEVGQSVSAGTYTLTESGGPSGYVASLWTCKVTGTSTVVPVTDAQVTLGLAADVTCEITNNDIQPTLKLVKNVTNNDGGTLVAADFPLSANGATFISGTAQGVNAGDYLLAEVQKAGYTASSWVCVGGSDTDLANATLTLKVGENVTCTITNDDVAPKLTLVKHVVNDDGGTAAAGDFTLKAGATTFVSEVGQSVSAGTYTLTESGGPSGYVASLWTCKVTGTSTVVPVTNAQVTLGLAADVTCEITNDDIAPKLTLVKDVKNDNGGSALASAFTLTAVGPDTNKVEGAGGGSGFVDAGIYTLSETGGPIGYTPSSWTCWVTGSNLEVSVPVTDSKVTLGLAADVTCKITNDDVAAKLTLVKHVVNDDGGTAAAGDFTLKAGATTFVSEVGQSVSAGTYTLTESGGPSGYVASLWTCKVTGTSTVVPVTNAQVTLGLAADVTCEITNHDVAPKLTLVKEVKGGTATIGQFTLRANTTTFTSGTSQDVVAGTVYTLTESGNAALLASYSPSAWDCKTNTGSTVTVTNASVTLSVGDDVTCTITNTAIVPAIDIVKSVGVTTDGVCSSNETYTDSILVVTGSKLCYEFKVTNTGTIALTGLLVTDPMFTALGIEITCPTTSLAAGASTTCYSATPLTASFTSGSSVTNTAKACANAANGLEACDTDTATYTGAYQGFTPGFWKMHADRASDKYAWDPAYIGVCAVSPSTPVTNVFTDVGSWDVSTLNARGKKVTVKVADYNGTGQPMTLLQALSLQGGSGDVGANEILLRAAVASYLNACYVETLYGPTALGEPGDMWPATRAEIVAMVTTVDASGTPNQIRSAKIALAAQFDLWNNTGTHFIDWNLV